MQETLEKKQIKNIDFNCDLAQSFGIYKNNAEYDLLDYVSSVNISCGFHAGDPIIIKNALMQAKEKNIVIGAHIGFDDIQGFGYRPMQLSEEEIEALVIYQIGAITSFAKTFGLEIEHVRPHGAMYKKCTTDFAFACSAILFLHQPCAYEHGHILWVFFCHHNCILLKFCTMPFFNRHCNFHTGLFGFHNCTFTFKLCLTQQFFLMQTSTAFYFSAYHSEYHKSK